MVGALHGAFYRLAVWKEEEEGRRITSQGQYNGEQEKRRRRKRRRGREGRKGLLVRRTVEEGLSCQWHIGDILKETLHNFGTTRTGETVSLS